MGEKLRAERNGAEGSTRKGEQAVTEARAKIKRGTVKTQTKAVVVEKETQEQLKKYR